MLRYHQQISCTIQAVYQCIVIATVRLVIGNGVGVVFIQPLAHALFIRKVVAVVHVSDDDVHVCTHGILAGGEPRQAVQQQLVHLIIQRLAVSAVVTHGISAHDQVA